MAVPRFDGYVFDLDGTVYLGDMLLPHAAETIATLRAEGRQVVFLSNNPTKTREQYAVKLDALGISTSADEIVNSSYAMTRWLLHEAPGCRVFVVGEQPLKDDLTAAGFHLTERASEVDFVIASFDRTFDYRKLQIAFDAIRAGARFVATNPDRYCPVPGGGEPDCAAMTAAIEACTATSVEVIVGKPSPIMVEIVSELIGIPLVRCVMVGDRLGTDIAMGVRAGMATALPLTGETTRELLATAEIQPNYVMETLAELVQ